MRNLINFILTIVTKLEYRQANIHTKRIFVKMGFHGKKHKEKDDKLCHYN